MEKGTIKFYNVIFPVWFLFFISPYVLLSVPFNLAVDALVVIVVLKTSGVYYNFSSSKIRKTILKVFGLGYLADIIGITLLMVLYGFFEPTVNYFRIWDNPTSIIVHILVVIFTGGLIYVFNTILFRRMLLNDEVVFKLAISLAIITAPWTFLIPASILY